MDSEVRVCDTCADVGMEDCLVVCHKCNDGAEHTYCMPIRLQKVPEEGDWICQVCMPREGTNKLVEDGIEKALKRKKGHSTYRQFIKGSNLKYRSSYVVKSEKTGESSAASLSAKRHQVPLEAQYLKKVKTIEINDASPSSSKPTNNSNSLLCDDTSSKKVKKLNIRSANELIYSVPERSSDSQEKAMVPHTSGDQGPMSTLTEFNEKERALKTRVKTSSSNNHSPSKNLEDAKLDAAGSVTFLEQFSNDMTEKLPDCLDTKGQLVKASCLQIQRVERNPVFHNSGKGKGPRIMSKPRSFHSVISGKSIATCSEILPADAYNLHNPAAFLLAYDSNATSGKGEKETVYSGETLFSRPNNIDAIESSRQLEHGLQASNHNTHKDPNSGSAKKRIESQQGEHPTKAAISVKSNATCSKVLPTGAYKLRNLREVKCNHNTCKGPYCPHGNKKNKSQQGEHSKKVISGKSNATGYDVVPANGTGYEVVPANATGYKDVLANAYKFLDPATYLLTSAPSVNVKEIVSNCKTLFSKPSNIDAVESSRQWNHGLQASNHNTHKDPNYSRAKKKFESQQGEHATNAAISVNSNATCSKVLPAGAYKLHNLREVKCNYNTHKGQDCPHGKKKNKGQQGEHPKKFISGKSNATGYEAVPSNATDYEVVSANVNGYEVVPANATGYEVIPANAYKLNDPTTCLLASDPSDSVEKSGKKLVSTGKTLFSKATNIDAVESSRQWDQGLQASNHNTREDPKCPNEKKKNENQQGEHPTKAVISMKSNATCSKVLPAVAYKLHNLREVKCNNNNHKGPDCSHGNKKNKSQQGEHPKKAISGKSNAIGYEVVTANAYKLHDPATCLLASDPSATIEKSEKEIVSNDKTLFSKPSNIDAVESSRQLDQGLQASNHNTLQDPGCPNEKKKNENQQGERPTKAATAKDTHTSCTGSASGERSHLKDLVLVEAASISQEFVNPEAESSPPGKFQMHNSEGIAKTCDGNQAPLSTCASLQVPDVDHRDAVKGWTFDLNAYPEDGDDEIRVDEIPELESKGDSGDKILMLGESSNAKEEAKAPNAVIDVNLSLSPEIAAPENGSNENPSTSVSLEPPASDWEDLNPEDKQLVHYLIFLRSKCR